MQGKTLHLIAGGLLMAAAASQAQADALQPDPAWQQGTLDNGFEWQVLATPQRPSDRIEVRLLIKTGSLSESTQQSGYSQFLPQFSLTHSGSLTAAQAQARWQQSTDQQRPLPPVIVSYDFTLYNLSLPNNRSDAVKEAITYLADGVGKLDITPESVNQTLAQATGGVVTWPVDTKEGWWRYRLKGSTLLGHDPAEALKQPVDAAQLAAFYQKWYTPDAMTLIVVGNVDSRSVIENITRHFGDLKGKRETPAPVPTLSPLPHDAVSIITNTVKQDRLSIIWDRPWQPICESSVLERYWRTDLAREALYWHVQQKLSKSKAKDLQVSFDCRVLYQRGQCGINIDSSTDKLNANLELIARELLNVRKSGLEQAAFDTLVAQKKLELQKLFATYARTDTDILVSQRLRALQNQVVDIAPEQYQKLRQQFLNSLTLTMINQDLRQLLSQDVTLTLLQPVGEPEFNVKALQAAWNNIMAVPPAAAPVATTPADTAPRQDHSGITPAGN